ncbi:unnamed protein product [Linum trigynum]|uniref:Reverse transcriptase zinc-binding domain-containing protein n=1 Tax=Linum trigynum TaxID=586398 RepID=A0AAV2E9L7_9ROSI
MRPLLVRSSLRIWCNNSCYTQSRKAPSRMWRLSSSGRFTMKTSYELTRREDDHHEHPIWKIAWQVEGIQRTRTFFELAMHQRLLTTVKRCRRHLALMDACQICGGGPEMILHIIRDCPYARAAWSE